MSVLLRGKWRCCPNCPGGLFWTAPQAPASFPLQMNLGLIAVVLVAFVSPVVVARECQRRAKELGIAGTPLAAPPSTEIHAETPH